MRSEPGGEESFELVVENDARITGEDVIIVAGQAIMRKEFAAPARWIIKRSSWANLQGMSVHARSKFMVGERTVGAAGKRQRCPAS